MMQTRSQTLQKIKANEFVFDFDKSSRAWRANKIKCANGCYKYKKTVEKEIRKSHKYNTRSSIKL
jgi:hypothetical protein